MKESLDSYDYIVLALVFLISILIAVYHGFKSKILKFFKKNEINNHNLESADNYLKANSTMGVIPITCSYLATFFSATAILGMPADVYMHGIQFWIAAFSFSACPLVGAFVTGPLFAKMKLSSVFEYLEIRFHSRRVRLVGTVCYLVTHLMGAAIFIYGPAISLQAFSAMSDTWCVLLVGSITTFYTAIGGIKGVIWTDLFQLVIMILSLLMVILNGLYDLGGIQNVFRISGEGGRLNLFDFNPDPFIRQSFWSLSIGFFFYGWVFYSSDQQMLQRFNASKSKKVAQRALLLNWPGCFIIFSLCCFSGLIVYATYADCDPLKSPNPLTKITNPNHLMIFYVKDKLEYLKGSCGFLIASIFCGSLSSISSTLSGMGAILWHDFFENKTRPEWMSQVACLKLIVCVCGVSASILALFLANFGLNLIQLSTQLRGAFVAPILGLFLLGCFFSLTSKKGVITGAVVGFLFSLVICLGAYFEKPVYSGALLATSIEGCLIDGTNKTNASLIISNLKPVVILQVPWYRKLFYLSYSWYSAVGGLVTVFVSLSTSLVCNLVSKLHKKDIEPHVYSSSNYIIFDFCACFYKKQKLEHKMSQQEINDQKKEVYVNQGMSSAIDLTRF
jgi:sodium-coupled monocarboxylate transporter 8/12